MLILLVGTWEMVTDRPCQHLWRSAHKNKWEHRGFYQREEGFFSHTLIVVFFVLYWKR